MYLLHQSFLNQHPCHQINTSSDDTPSLLLFKNSLDHSKKKGNIKADASLSFEFPVGKIVKSGYGDDPILFQKHVKLRRFCMLSMRMSKGC